MNLKNILVNSATAAILAGGVMVVGAQDATEEPQPAVTEDAQASAFGQRGGGFGFRDGDGRGPRGGFGERGRFGGIELRELVEQYTGLEGTALRDAMRDGGTVASLIEANDGDVDAFVAEAVTLAEARIDAAVERGRITEDRATTMKEGLSETITTMVNSERPVRDGLRGPGGRGGRGGGMMNEDTAALIETYTGLEPQAVAEALRSGGTLASLIEANDGDVDAFITEMTAIAEARIEERTAQRLENLPAAIEAFVNGERPVRDGLRGTTNSQ